MLNSTCCTVCSCFWWPLHSFRILAFHSWSWWRLVPMSSCFSKLIPLLSYRFTASTEVLGPVSTKQSQNSQPESWAINMCNRQQPELLDQRWPAHSKLRPTTRPRLESVTDLLEAVFYQTASQHPPIEEEFVSFWVCLLSITTSQMIVYEWILCTSNCIVTLFPLKSTKQINWNQNSILSFSMRKHLWMNWFE